LVFHKVLEPEWCFTLQVVFYIASGVLHCKRCFTLQVVFYIASGVLHCKWSFVCVFVILVFITFVLVQLVTSIAGVVHNVTRTAVFVFYLFFR
jgi:hypothetical protein